MRNWLVCVSVEWPRHLFFSQWDIVLLFTKPQDKATFNSHDIKIEPCHEKTGLLPIYENEGGDICAVTDQSLCFRYTHSTIPLLPRSETSSFYPCPVAV